jgi:type II secretory ATPase GspE/PulE/Tfp pilus assembly ATPase PilB-like protein
MLDFRRVLLGKASRSRIGDLLPLARRGKAVFAGVEELTLRQTLEGLADYATRAPLHGLTLLVHMRLIRTLCPACRRSTAVRFPLEALKNATLYVRGPGCPECRDGFVGAMAFFEVLTIDRILREALEREGVGAEDVRRALQQIDNATRDRLAQAAADGRVSAAELSDYL